ncbi:unnamed protein product [Urochloa humidicola]
MCLPPGFLSNDRGFDHMTAKRYFPATEEEDIGFSEHEDSNCITFIFQDGVGGLEGLKNGRWVPAEHVDGSIIVNIGDVMQVLSNGKLKSATHRVVRKLVNRHSFAFFFNLHVDKWVEPLPEDRRGAALQEVPVQGVPAATCEDVFRMTVSPTTPSNFVQ